MTIAFPHPPGSGGPGSFQLRFEGFIKSKGWKTIYSNDKTVPDIVLVVGGTRRIGWLLKMKIKRVPIVYRLDGIIWLHTKKKTALKNLLLSGYRNMNNKMIHAFLADHIIYQSRFACMWWHNCGWLKRTEYTIINNGVDLNLFKPGKQGDISLTCLEGKIDYSPYSVWLLNTLRHILPESLKMNLYGGFEESEKCKELDERINYFGQIPRNEVSSVLQNTIYLSLDVNPACPNTVIEALACGSPVVAFDTGSLKELVPTDAGIIVPYGSDPWKLANPDHKALGDAITAVYNNWGRYSEAARRTAEIRFNLEYVFNLYLDVFNSLLKAR